MNGFGTNVGLADYEAHVGFSFGSSSGLGELMKALSGTPDGTHDVSGRYTGGRTLIVESLENTLKVITYKEQMLRLWPDIIKKPAFSTVEEFNELSQYADERGAFITESDMVTLVPPDTNDATYTRRVALVKYLGTTRVVSHPMTLVRGAHGDVVALEAQAGTLYLLKKMENALFEASSVLGAAEFDGILQQHYDHFGNAAYRDNVLAARAADNIIDMRGDQLSEDVIEAAMSVAIGHYGMPTDIYLSTDAMSDLGKVMFPKERVNLPMPNAEGRVGFAVREIMTQHGLLKFKPDVFLNPSQPQRVKFKNASAIGDTTKIPNTPTAGDSKVTLITAGTGGQWDGHTTADGYRHFYLVTAANRYGESAPAVKSATMAANFATAAGGIQVTSPDDAVQLATITDSGSGGAAWSASAGVNWLNVYRHSMKTSASSGATVITNSTPFHLIARVPLHTVVASGYADGVDDGLTVAAAQFYDLNETLPGTSMAYVLEHGEQTLQFKQLAPLMKLPLAVVSPAIRFAMLLYGTPIAYARRKMVFLRNIAGINQ